MFPYARESYDSSWPANEITPGVYVGRYEASLSQCELEKRDITYIITVMNERPESFRQISNLRYQFLQCDDSSNNRIDRHFDRASQTIKAARKKNQGVLIHCYAGVSRSVTIACAWLIRSQSMTVKDAIRFVQSKRRQADPNSGFRLQLERWHKKTLRLHIRQFRHKTHLLLMELLVNSRVVLLVTHYVGDICLS